MNEPRPCPVCRAQRGDLFCLHENVRFVRCAGCGSLYQRDPPDWDRIQRIYQEEYHLRRGHSANPAIESAKIATVSAYLRRLERLNPPGRELLEIGCSSGAGLTAAVQRGWSASGVEVSELSAAAARARLGVKAVHTGSMEDAPWPAGSFDAVSLFDVIEHIEPPAPTLAAIRRVLRPGGLVLMVTPNAASWSARMMRGRWPHLFVEHVVIFSPGGMRRLLEQQGFQVLAGGFAWKRVNLDMLVRHAHLHPHILFGSVLRGVGRVLPRTLLRTCLPFNIGEFYVIARRAG